MLVRLRLILLRNVTERTKVTHLIVVNLVLAALRQLGRLLLLRLTLLSGLRLCSLTSTATLIARLASKSVLRRGWVFILSLPTSSSIARLERSTSLVLITFGGIGDRLEAEISFLLFVLFEEKLHGGIPRQGMTERMERIFFPRHRLV